MLDNRLQTCELSDFLDQYTYKQWILFNKEIFDYMMDNYEFEILCGELDSNKEILNVFLIDDNSSDFIADKTNDLFIIRFIDLDMSFFINQGSLHSKVSYYPFGFPNDEKEV